VLAKRSIKREEPMFEFKTLKWSVYAPPDRPDEKCIGLITLARPEALNAIDVRMRVELDLIFDQIRRDDRLRVVIITGEGRGFSAGGDLRSEAAPLGALEGEHDFGDFGPYKELANYFFNDLRHIVIQRAIRKLEELQAVTIAAINGPAVGIGLELATACDMRYASDKAKLGEVAVPAGFVPESGGARNLPKFVGLGRAMEMILTGEIVDAAEAHRPRRARLPARQTDGRSVQDRCAHRRLAVPLRAPRQGARAPLLGSQQERGRRAGRA
jgi:enoyl-CoA hydratase/carnithine racemase